MEIFFCIYYFFSFIGFSVVKRATVSEVGVLCMNHQEPCMLQISACIYLVGILNQVRFAVTVHLIEIRC